MQYFHEEKLLSTHNSRRSQRRRNFETQAKSVLEEIELKRTMDEALDSKQEKILKEDIHNFMNNDYKHNKKNYNVQEEENTLLNEKVDEICKDLFFFTVYESLLVDDEVKNRNFTYIREQSNKFFDMFNNKNLINIKEGSGFQDVMDASLRILQENFNSGNSIDTKEIIRKTIISEDFTMFYAIESIKAKTAECLKNEKKGAIIKEQLEIEDKYIDPNKSLFRTLFEENLQYIIEQKGNEVEPDYIQDMSMIETILDYTILESANTLQLVKFTNLKKVLNMKNN